MPVQSRRILQGNRAALFFAVADETLQHLNVLHTLYTHLSRTCGDDTCDPTHVEQMSEVLTIGIPLENIPLLNPIWVIWVDLDRKAMLVNQLHKLTAESVRKG
ncbi:unnamed protein product [Leuciscus chuanchicus]